MFTEAATYAHMYARCAYVHVCTYLCTLGTQETLVFSVTAVMNKSSL